jgi:hypothetical protein
MLQGCYLGVYWQKKKFENRVLTQKPTHDFSATIGG